MTAPAPNRAVIRRWVDALRSGAYHQGRKRLYRPVDNTYCCLGVLCDLHRQDVGGEWVVTAGMQDARYFGNSVRLPGEVRAWAGLKYAALLMPYRSLIVLNDSVGLTFTEIADLIEAQFLADEPEAGG